MKERPFNKLDMKAKLDLGGVPKKTHEMSEKDDQKTKSTKSETKRKPKKT